MRLVSVLYALMYFSSEEQLAFVVNNRVYIAMHIRSICFWLYTGYKAL